MSEPFFKAEDCFRIQTTTHSDGTIETQGLLTINEANAKVEELKRLQNSADNRHRKIEWELTEKLKIAVEALKAIEHGTPGASAWGIAISALEKIK